MKRYLVFGYDVYYPYGGLNDLIGTFNTEEEIDDYFLKEQSNKDKFFFKRDHYQVLDIQTGTDWAYKL